MADTHLLRGGTLLRDWSGTSIIADGAVAWRDGLVLAAGPRAEVEAAHPEAVRHESRGGWIAPGLTNAHHHLYSTLAAGLDPGLPIEGFGQCLDRLWWRLDRAHDEASIRLSARLGALRCALAGVTTIVDHHSSPSLIAGSLDMIAEELEAAGLSAVLCYETTDRNGHEGALAGLAESARFRDATRRHPRFRGLIGLHSVLTLGGETLRRASDLAEEGDIHVHLGEAQLETDECLARGMRPHAFLLSHGLVGPASWIAHGVHLQQRELVELAARGALLVHNPESNANNQVGCLSLRAAREAGLPVALGTDGMSACLLTTLRSAFLLHRRQQGDAMAGWRECAGLLDTAGERLARLFGQPGYGRLVKGAPADLIVLDEHFPSELSESTLLGRLLFGQVPPRVRHTVARGDFLVRDFQPQRQDAGRLAREGIPVRQALWGRFAGLAAGTPYLGAASAAE
jgi:cytosine/adenosine deaminase-related metal-dependent hydrolase